MVEITYDGHEVLQPPLSLAEHLANLLAETANAAHGSSVLAPPVGSVDINLYRDDAATALPSPRIGPSNMPINIEKNTSRISP